MTCVQNPYTNGNCPQITSDPATNRMTLVGTATPSYDTNGNLTIDGTTLNTYSYDAEGRLTKINNSQHVSISYAYNALGQLVEDDRSNWGGPDIEIFYDPFGRRIGDFDYVTRGFGYWKTGYVTYDAPVGHYDGVSSDPSVRTYTTTYRNYLDSMRWETSNGTDAESDALYRPFGDEWYTCTIYGSGITSYANMDPYCVCYGVAVRPDGRPYIPGLGRSMSTRPSDLLDPDLLNKYAYGGNDPINNVDSGGSDGPNKPPQPGSDQDGNAIQGNPDITVALSFNSSSTPYDPNAWVFPETIDASTQSSPGAGAAPQQQDVPLPETAQVVLPLVYQSTKSLQSPWFPVAWYGSSAIAGGILVYTPAGLQASWGFLLTHPAVVNCVADFAHGFASPPGGYSSFCGVAGQWVSTAWGAH